MSEALNMGARDADFLFDTPAERMWEEALKRMHISPAALAPAHGIH